MSHVVAPLDLPSSYKDSQSEVRRKLTSSQDADLTFPQHDRDTERRLLAESCTLYVGNLSFYTTEAQIYERKSPCHPS
jgi:nuclear cap-binding protein subunit 2